MDSFASPSWITMYYYLQNGYIYHLFLLFLSLFIYFVLLKGASSIILSFFKLPWLIYIIINFIIIPYTMHSTLYGIFKQFISFFYSIISCLNILKCFKDFMFIFLDSCRYVTSVHILFIFISLHPCIICNFSSVEVLETPSTNWSYQSSKSPK